VRYLAEQMKSITLLEKKFGDVHTDELPSGNSIYVFFFNILGYIDEPVSIINRLLKKGDILFISSWNYRNDRARKIRTKYFDYLNSFEKSVVIDPTETIGICNLDFFPFKSLKYYKSHKRIIGSVTDILIIYT
jgi:hypothetical protein